MKKKVYKKTHQPKKKEIKQPFFPNISRFIPASNALGSIAGWPELWRKHRRIAVLVTSMLITFALVLSGFELSRVFEEHQKLQTERNKIQQEISEWVEITQKYTGYRDAYFRLAILEYQLGNKEKALKYVEKALELDPNFEQGRELEKILKQ